MRLTEIDFKDAMPIESYGPDFFRISDEVIGAPAIVHAKGAMSWQGLDNVDQILALQGEVDFILLGTGADLRHAPAGFKAALEAAGIGVEVMKTASACRTYNVLVSEGRRVAAALLPIGEEG